MKAVRRFLCGMTMLIMSQAGAQSTSLEICFTARDSQAFTALDSVRVMNLTHPGDTILYYPDSVLVLTYVTSAGDPAGLELSLLKLTVAGANPFCEKSRVGLFMPGNGRAEISVFNVPGQLLLQQTLSFCGGEHLLDFYPGNDRQYLLRVVACGQQRSLRLLCDPAPGQRQPRLEPAGMQGTGGMINTKELLFNDFWFCPGDELCCIGYADGAESGFNLKPQVSDTLVFQFASNMPCPGLDSILYEGQWYRTVQIFSQCWLAENLNVGVQLITPAQQTDNELIEKYCLLNNPAYCETYGGIYLWNEMMQYSTLPGSRGVCPEGWHIPADHDWQVLAGATDSFWKIGDPVWNTNGNCGDDCGYNLKSTSGWYNNGNGCDCFGFNALSGGYYYFNGNWAGGDLFTIFFSSSLEQVGSNLQPWSYGMSWMWNDIVRSPHSPQSAMPVRCIRDY